MKTVLGAVLLFATTTQHANAALEVAFARSSGDVGLRVWGGDVLSINVTGADADSKVWFKLVAPAEDTTRHCTGYYGVRHGDSGVMVFNKEVNVDSDGAASIDWFVPNVDYSREASYSILAAKDELVGMAGKGEIDNDRTGCSKPLWAASSVFPISYNPVLPTITGDFALGRTGQLVYPGSPQIIQGVGASWKEIGYVYLTLEASVNDFRCEGAAENSHLNTAPCSWAQSRSKERSSNWDGWLSMVEVLGTKEGTPYDAAGVTESEWKKAAGIAAQGFATQWEVPKKRADMFGQERHLVEVDGKLSEKIVALDGDTHRLDNPAVSLRIKIEGLNKALSGKSCLHDSNGDGICSETDDVTEIYSGVFKLGLSATCGDANGANEGVVPTTSELCGADFVPKGNAAAEQCDGTVCLFSAKIADKATCCIEQATCGDKDGVGFQRLSVDDDDCGAGYIHRVVTENGDDDIDAERCEGAVCDTAGAGQDRDTCCIALATCGDTNGIEDGDPDVTLKECGVGRIPDPNAIADPTAFTRSYLFKKTVVDRDTCCLSLATCGDKNGPDADGVVAISDDECGEGFVAKPGVGMQYCAGPNCDVANAADRDVCCVAQATCGDRTNAAIVLSCGDLGWPLQPKGDPDAKSCGKSDNGWDCTANVEHDAAAAVCKAAGARLCHVQEFYDNVLQGTGCDFDVAYVWTDEPCSIGGGKNGAGWLAVRGKGSHEVPDLCLQAGEVSNVRCCSDPDTVVATTSDFNPITDADCGFGYLAKESTEDVRCDGLVCNVAGGGGDRESCCISTTTTTTGTSTTTSLSSTTTSVSSTTTSETSTTTSLTSTTTSVSSTTTSQTSTTTSVSSTTTSVSSTTTSVSSTTTSLTSTTTSISTTTTSESSTTTSQTSTTTSLTSTTTSVSSTTTSETSTTTSLTSTTTSVSSTTTSVSSTTTSMTSTTTSVSSTTTTGTSTTTTLSSTTTTVSSTTTSVSSTTTSVSSTTTSDTSTTTSITSTTTSITSTTTTVSTTTYTGTTSTFTTTTVSSTTTTVSSTTTSVSSTTTSVSSTTTSETSTTTSFSSTTTSQTSTTTSVSSTTTSLTSTTTSISSTTTSQTSTTTSLTSTTTSVSSTTTSQTSTTTSLTSTTTSLSSTTTSETSTTTTVSSTTTTTSVSTTTTSQTSTTTSVSSTTTSETSTTTSVSSTTSSETSTTTSMSSTTTSLSSTTTTTTTTTTASSTTTTASSTTTTVTSTTRTSTTKTATETTTTGTSTTVTTTSITSTTVTTTTATVTTITSTTKSGTSTTKTTKTTTTTATTSTTTLSSTTTTESSTTTVTTLTVTITTSTSTTENITGLGSTVDDGGIELPIIALYVIASIVGVMVLISAWVRCTGGGNADNSVGGVKKAAGFGEFGGDGSGFSPRFASPMKTTSIFLGSKSPPGKYGMSSPGPLDSDYITSPGGMAGDPDASMGFFVDGLHVDEREEEKADDSWGHVGVLAKFTDTIGTEVFSVAGASATPSTTARTHFEDRVLVLDNGGDANGNSTTDDVVVDYPDFGVPRQTQSVKLGSFAVSRTTDL